jgi:general nucleoside transport system ATP-binding protein
VLDVAGVVVNLRAELGPLRLVELRDQGKAIVLVSVELDEIRALSDRILVMFSGSIVGECGPSASESDIGLLMAGIVKTKAA